jgi:hypothetical protein
MITLMINWQPILNKCSSISPETSAVVYLAVGSAMGHWTNIDPNKNQQYPPFLSKFHGQKIIILIDPILESNLTIVRELKNKGIGYNLYQMKKSPSSIVQSQISTHEITIFAFNEEFNYPEPFWSTNGTDPDCEINMSYLYKLINICMGRTNPIKFIFQDYTGRDISNLYVDLFDSHPKHMLLSNVIFDVTQQSGNCFVEFSDDLQFMDGSNNFIQEKYIKLDKISSKMIQQIKKDRIKVLIYPITLNYLKEYFTPCPYINMFKVIYGIKTSEPIQLYEQVIKLLVADIVKTFRSKNESFYQTLEIQEEITLLISMIKKDRYRFIDLILKY